MEKFREAANVHLASIRDHFVSRISDEEGVALSEIFERVIAEHA